MPAIKIECACGQRYAFDIEPGQTEMPFAVSCPACGADGTGAANRILEESSGTLASKSLEATRLRRASRLQESARVLQQPSLGSPLNEDDSRDLKTAKLDVKRTVSVAAIVAGIHLLFGFLSVFGYPILGATSLSILHACILLGLAYGVHRFSRVCAVTLFAYYLADRFYTWEATGRYGGVVIFAVVLYCFGTGAFATFTYHRLVKSPG